MKTTNARSRRSEAREGHDPANAPVYGALDLGSNNCRLLIARPHRRGFRVIDAFSRIVRLGEGLAASGSLSADAMNRTIEALRVCQAKLLRRGVTRLRGIATAACRDAENCDSFLERAKIEAGISLEAITPAEESRLALASCELLLDHAVPHALIFDIGGGSTEIIWAAINSAGVARIKGWRSLPCGVISLSEKFGQTTMPPEIYEDMVGHVSDLLAPFESEHRLRDKLEAGEMQVLGTSGTVTTIGGLHLGLKRYDRRRVDGMWLPLDAFREIATELGAMSIEERRAQACMGPERADMVVAGCAILEAIARLWPFAGLRVADRGLREGLLLGMMRADGHWHHPNRR